MPSDSSRRSELSTWLATPTSEFQTTGNLNLEPAPRPASDTDESIFAPTPLVQVDRATGYLTTRTLSSGEVDAMEGAASKRGTRRLLPLALVPVLMVLLAAGWAILSTASSTPASSPTTTLPSFTQGAGKSNGQAQPQAVPSRQAPGLAGAEITRTPTSTPRRNTPTPRPTRTSTAAATTTPMPTNTPLPTDTPVPTNTPIPTDTPAPPTATPVPPTNTPQPFVRYVVRPGDNLSTIAARFGTTVNAIVRTNRLAGTRIIAGQSLIIPVAGSR